MKKNSWLLRPMVAAVGGCFSMAPVWGNPTGPQVIQGAAQIQGLGTNSLKVTNTPGAILHWQGFSIGAGQVTQFVQQSASSAVLNRVVGADISQIHGQLLSNGRVFLINPAGILIGAGGIIDTAGFVGSTLNMLDADFLAGKLKFHGDASSGSIVNQGWIRTGHGGNVVLVAPNIENSGLIHAPGGQLVLAAGQKMTIGSLDLEGVQFEIQAPADSVLNVGKLLASGGAVGVFAGTLKHTGDIRANALMRDEGGRVVLKAQGDVTATAGSAIHANGKVGGNIVIQSTAGHASVGGEVTADGSAGRGGDVRLLGERVSLVDNAKLSASGAGAGGQIRVGGDFQGKNAEVQNAARTFVAPGAVLKADATDSGDGGRIIVWADKATQYYGTLSARGGAEGGNGGFAEVSGKHDLIFMGNADLGAAKGLAGDLLLDPLDLFADIRGGLNPNIIDSESDFPGNAVTVSPDTLANINANVTLFASRHMRIGSNITLNPGRSFSATVAEHTPLLHATGVNEGTPPNRLDLAANITTSGAGVTLSAPAIRSFETAPGVAPVIATSGGGVAITSTGSIDGNTVAGRMAINAGGGAVSVSNVPSETINSIQLGAVGAGAFTSQSTGTLTTGALTTTGGGIDLTSVNGSIQIQGAVFSGGGAVSATAPGSITVGQVNADSIDTAGGAVELRSTGTFGNVVQTRSILTGSGAVTLEGSSITTTPAASVIETTGAVNLTAKSGDINVRVNGSSGVTASARRTNTNVSINIDSTGTLNIASADAETTACFFGSCASATVTLASSGGNLSVGNITAKAPVFNAGGSTESVAESIHISTTGAGNSIFALPSGSQVKAVDVTLETEALMGGSIGGASALNVDARRTFTFNPNGAFNVALNGASGPNRLIAEIGRMPAAGSYNDSRVLGNGVNLLVDANDTTVTVENLTITANAGGFGSAVHRTSPLVSLTVPNGALHVGALSVPAGGAPQGAAPPVSGALPVILRAQGPAANGNLTLESYTRTGAANPSTLTLSSTNGMVTLGTLAAANDAVTVTAAGDVVFSPGGSLTTGGSVNMTSTNGSFMVGLIDTSSGGTGSSVSLTASCAAAGTCAVTNGGNVFALTDGPGLEILSAGDVTIDGRVIGNQGGVTNPFDITAAADRLVTLTSRSAGGRIGASTAAPLIANANRITINASDATDPAEFDVSTGVVDIKDLIVALNPDGLSRVTSNGRIYQFESGGAGLELSVDAASNTQFASGLFRVTVPEGMDVQNNIDLGTTGSLELFANRGEINAASRALSAKNITLTAGSDPTGTVGIAAITVGSIGIGGFRPDTVNITAGTAAGADRVGAFESGGTILGSAINITTFGNPGPGGPGPGPGISMKFGSNSEDDIGGPAAGARATRVTLDARTLGNQSGTIGVGDIFADESITIRSAAGISVNNGSLQAPTIFVGAPEANPTLFPTVTIGGAPGSVIPIHRMEVRGSSVNIPGAITGDGVANGALLMSSSAGALTVGGAITGFGDTSTIDLASVGGVLNLGPAGAGVITTGNGSIITLSHAPATPSAFGFATLDAGATGSVTITTNSNDITQQVGGTGITAGTVVLSSGTGTIGHANGAGPDNGQLDLNGVTKLTLTSGNDVALDANGSTLDVFNFTKSAEPDSAPFTLANLGSGQSIVLVEGPGGMGVDATAYSPTVPLDFIFNYAVAGEPVRLVADPAATAGAQTSGGTVNISAIGAIDASAGIDTTGVSPDGRGHVTLRSTGGSITTGAITTSETALKPASLDPVRGPEAVSITTECAGCDILVGGPLFSGTGGGPIALRVLTSGSITGGGLIRSDSADSVTVFTQDGNIGAGGVGNGLQIQTPHAILTAGSTNAANGFVFADLFGTTNLNLSANQGFNVTSDTAFATLSVATLGSGTGNVGTSTLNLTAPGQTYTFNRTATDLFSGAPLTNTFEVVQATGALTSATFRALDGDLLVKGTPGGAAPIDATNLTLDAVAGALKLQGNAATPLTLTNTGTQTFTANGNVEIGRQATISGGTQTISSTNGSITFAGGTAAGEAVNVSATVRQHIFTTLGTGGNVVFQGGSAEGTSVTASFNGALDPGLDAVRQAEQQIEAGGSIQILGGSGGSAADPAFVLVTGNQRQLIRADGDILLSGGGAPGAKARIVNTGTENQQIGESRCFGIGCTDEPYQTNNVVMQGGSGDGSSVEISAMGPQQILARDLGVSPGDVNVLGGSGIDTFARIVALGTGEQSIGGQRRIGSLIVAAGTGGVGADGGAFALIGAANTKQTILGNNNLQLTATTNNATLSGGRQNIGFFGAATLDANSADALIEATSTVAQAFEYNQILSANTIALNGGGVDGATAQILAKSSQSVSGSATLTGGAGPNAFVRISNEGGPGSGSFGQASQQLSLGNAVLAGGAAGSFARIDAVNGDQQLSYTTLMMTGGAAGAFTSIDALNGNQTLSGGNMTLTAAGDATTSVANAGAIIEGRNQNKTNNGGIITLNGGAGIAGGSSDALLRNLAGNQNIRSNRIVINGGFHDSTTGIHNLGTGTQLVQATGTDGISVTGRATGTGADLRILNNSANLQTVNASNGPLALSNNGIGIVDIRSEGAQAVTGNGGIAVSAAASGSSSITAETSQTFSFNNGDLSVNTTGAGNASIAAKTSQIFTSNNTGGVLVNTTAGGNADITAGTTQRVTAAFVDVSTALGSTGNSTIASTDNQWLRTTNAAPTPGPGSLGVAARGSGLASIQSGARQLLEIDYPEVMTAAVAPPGSVVVGAADAMGTSRIQGVDQSIFARSIVVQAGAAAGTGSKNTGPSSHITGTNTQAISLLDGNLSVLGGSGANSTAVVDPVVQSAVVNGSIIVTGGSAPGAVASIAGNQQTLVATKGDILVTGGSIAGANASIVGTVQDLTASNNVAVNAGAADATIQALGSQAINAVMAMTIAGAAGNALVTAAGPQTIQFGSLGVTTGNAGGASLHGDGTQQLTGGNVTLTAVGANTTALVDAAGEQIFNVNDVMLNGGANPGAAARIKSSAGQALTFRSLFMNTGAGSGSTVMVDASGAQTLTASNGNIELIALTPGASAIIQGHSQTLACDTACNVNLTLHGGASDAQLINLSGNQSITAGTMLLMGGPSTTTGILNQGGGTQSVTARVGGIVLDADMNATGSAAVLIKNVPATAQTITAAGDLTLNSRGAGAVAIASAGAQGIDVRAIDVQTHNTGAGGANAAVSAAADQTIRTRGVLATAAGVSARVGSGSTGTAKIDSGAAQTLNIGHTSDTQPDTLDDRQFVIGRTNAGDAAGDSLVLAATNQTVRAGSLLIQGPSGNDRLSKLSTTDTQIITTLTGGVSILGGAGDNSLATIDPTDQSISSFGPMLLQGGSGSNADSSIIATGPQTITNLNGPIALVGGTGPGADALILTTGPQSVISQNGAVTLTGGSGLDANALIETSSPFQTVSGTNGVIIQTGPAFGGIAGLRRGQLPGNAASATVAGTLLREQDELDRLFDESASRENEEERRQGRPQLCS